jgi:hypothetical protein
MQKSWNLLPKTKQRCSANFFGSESE